MMRRTYYHYIVRENVCAEISAVYEARKRNQITVLTEHSKAVVKGNNNYMFVYEKVRTIDIPVSGARYETSAVYPDHHSC
jgi:hypothetical protein